MIFFTQQGRFSPSDRLGQPSELKQREQIAQWSVIHKWEIFSSILIFCIRDILGNSLDFLPLCIPLLIFRNAWIMFLNWFVYQRSISENLSWSLIERLDSRPVYLLQTGITQGLAVETIVYHGLINSHIGMESHCLVSSTSLRPAPTKRHWK